MTRLLLILSLTLSLQGCGKGNIDHKDIQVTQ